MNDLSTATWVAEHRLRLEEAARGHALHRALQPRRPSALRTRTGWLLVRGGLRLTQGRPHPNGQRAPLAAPCP